MKSILVCAAQAPFVTGGAEIHVRELVKSLAARGFRVDVVSLPFHAHPPSEVVRQALAWRLLELRHTTGESVDLVIPTKFPSYLVRHHRKVAWVFHQYREAYELHGHRAQPARLEPRGPAARRDDPDAWTTRRSASAGRFSPTRGTWPSASRASTASTRRRSTRRRSSWAATAATATVASCSRPGAWTGRSARSCCCGHSRSRRKDARLKLTGEGPLRRDLERLAAQLGIEGRVDFLGFVPEDELVALYATCRGVLYAPYDEDYGYVTVEGFLSRKPVVTASDSGGPLEFVEDGASGFVAAPEPAALADAIDRLWSLPEPRLREMGEDAARRVASITWETVVDRLTELIR